MTKRAKSPMQHCKNLDLFASPATQPALESTDTVPSEAGFELRISTSVQLGLFEHTADKAATAARQALADLDAARVRHHLIGLRQSPAHVQFVADLDLCIHLIERDDPRWVDAKLAMPWIESELWPAATRRLKRDAMLLVRPALLALLEGGRADSFDATCPHAHVSYVWKLLGQAEQALTALERDSQWRNQAASLQWHAQLCELAEFHERLRADIVELCLKHAPAAESWLSASLAWQTTWSAWCDLDDALPIYAFPAWCRLTRAIAFQPADSADQCIGAQLLRIAQQLAQTPADAALRKALHALSPALLAEFLAARAAPQNR